MSEVVLGRLPLTWRPFALRHMTVWAAMTLTFPSKLPKEALKDRPPRTGDLFHGFYVLHVGEPDVFAGNVEVHALRYANHDVDRQMEVEANKERGVERAGDNVVAVQTPERRRLGWRPLTLELDFPNVETWRHPVDVKQISPVVVTNALRQVGYQVATTDKYINKIPKKVLSRWIDDHARWEDVELEVPDDKYSAWRTGFRMLFGSGYGDQATPLVLVRPAGDIVFIHPPIQEYGAVALDSARALTDLVGRYKGLRRDFEGHRLATDYASDQLPTFIEEILARKANLDAEAIPLRQLALPAAQDLRDQQSLLRTALRYAAMENAYVRLQMLDGALGASENLQELERNVRDMRSKKRNNLYDEASDLAVFIHNTRASDLVDHLDITRSPADPTPRKDAWTHMLRNLQHFRELWSRYDEAQFEAAAAEQARRAAEREAVTAQAVGGLVPVGAPYSKLKVKDLKKFASQDAERWGLNDVFATTLGLAATDGHRAVVARAPFNLEPGIHSVVVQQRSYDKPLADLTRSDFELPLLGDPPDVAQVIPDTDRMQVFEMDVDTARMIRTTKLADFAPSSAIPLIHLRLSDGTWHLGPPPERDGYAMFNAKYVREALLALNKDFRGESIPVYYDRKLAPILLGDRYGVQFHIIMPMRID